MSLIATGPGNAGRVAAYGPAMFGAGASESGPGLEAPISGTSFGGQVQAGLSGGGDGPGGRQARGPGTSIDGQAAARKPIFQSFQSAFQAQLLFQQTASFKPSAALALATMVAETYDKIMNATRPDGLAQTMPEGQTVFQSPGVNFLA